MVWYNFLFSNEMFVDHNLEVERVVSVPPLVKETFKFLPSKRHPLNLTIQAWRGQQHELQPTMHCRQLLLPNKKWTGTNTSPTITFSKKIYFNLSSFMVQIVWNETMHTPLIGKCNLTWQQSESNGICLYKKIIAEFMSATVWKLQA